MALARGDQDGALTRYYYVVLNFPKGNRIDSARVGAASIEFDRGNVDAAMRALNGVQLRRLSDAERQTANRLLAGGARDPVAKIGLLATFRSGEPDEQVRARIDGRAGRSARATRSHSTRPGCKAGRARDPGGSRVVGFRRAGARLRRLRRRSKSNRAGVAHADGARLRDEAGARSRSAAGVGIRPGRYGVFSDLRRRGQRRLAVDERRAGFDRGRAAAERKLCRLRRRGPARHLTRRGYVRRASSHRRAPSRAN